MNSSVSKVLHDLRLLGGRVQNAQQRRNAQSWAATDLNPKYQTTTISPRVQERHKKAKRQRAETQCDSLDVGSSKINMQVLASRADGVGAHAPS